MSQPRKKNRKKKKKSRWAPPVSRPPLPLFCSARRERTRRRRRRPFSGHVPAILVRRAQPSLLSRPYPRPADPVPPQTLTLAFPSSIAAAPKPCRRRSPPRFSCSGELWLNSSLGELLLALLLRFRRSPGLIRLPAGPPPRRFAVPPPLSVAPPLRRSSSPTSPPVRLAYSSSSLCAPPLVRSGPASSRRLTPPSASARGPRRGRAHPGSRPPGLP